MAGFVRFGCFFFLVFGFAFTRCFEGFDCFRFVSFVSVRFLLAGGFSSSTLRFPDTLNFFAD